MGLPATAGKSAELELVMDWRSNEAPVFVEAGCRWTEPGGRLPGLKAGFEVVEVRHGDFSRLLEDVSPLSLSDIAPSDLNVFAGTGEVSIDADCSRDRPSERETAGWEEKISRVRFLKILDILSAPCLLIDGRGCIIHANGYSANISPDIFRFIGKPFASIFPDRDLPARVKEVSGTQSFLQATLRIQEKLVPCRIESRTLEGPAGAHLLVFLKPWASRPSDSEPQIGDAPTFHEMKPASDSPGAALAHLDGPFAAGISEPLNGDRGETLSDAESCSPSETWTAEIDPGIAGTGESLSGTIHLLEQPPVRNRSLWGFRRPEASRGCGKRSRLR